MAEIALAVAALGGVLAVLGGLWVLHRGLSAAAVQLQPREDGEKLRDLAAEVAALKTEVKGLPSLWEDERERAQAAYARARAAKSAALRAQGEREEDEEDEWDDEGEVPGLFQVHEGGGGGGRMQTMRPGLGGDVTDDLKARARAAGIL